MNVLNKFTIKNLKLNKKRSIVTGIGILLSAALICAVAGMITSVRQTIINAEKNDSGDYHTAYYDVPQEELKNIEENKDIESYFETSETGWAYLFGCKNDSKPYVRILSFTDEALKKAGIKLEEGRMPQNNCEIVIPKHIISDGRVDFKIGDKVTLNVGERKLVDGINLTQDIPLYDATTREKQNEVIDNTKTKTYTIVGVIERPNYTLEKYNSPGYTIISYANNIKDLKKADIYVRYNNIKDYKKAEEKILSVKSEGSQYKIDTNTELLRYEGAVSEETMRVLYGIAAVVICIIVVSSVFVIRNSFGISVAEKNKQYGMLSSIGATGKQIRKSVLLEGAIIGLIAIPLGIICGIIAIVVLILLLNMIMADMLNGVTFVYSVPLIPIVLTILMSAVTIYLSCLIPAIKAGKTSPIDSIRGNNDVKIKAKKLKTSKLFMKIFGIGGVIASKNLKRSRKKYRTTIISLVVSISIFISLSSFMNYGTKMTDIYYTELTFNITVQGSNNSIYKEILNLDGIEKYVKYDQKQLPIDMRKFGTEEGIKINSNKDETNLGIQVMNDEAFKSYLKDIGESEVDFDKKVILIDEYMVKKDDGKKSVNNILNVNEGDSITVNNEDSKLDIQITKRTDKRPMGYEGSYVETGIIFVSQSYANSIGGLSDAGLYIKAKDASKLETEINKIKDSNIEYSDTYVQNIETYASQNNKMFLIVSIFLYGFISVITLIGVTNIFNTITTNMILRSKEFAMLKSIGMTTKEFNKMIRLESILYGLKSLFIGIPIGLIGTYFIYKSFAENTDVGYIFPTNSIFIAIVFVFIIVGLTMKYSLNKINNQNIIDTIRNENV